MGATSARTSATIHGSELVRLVGSDTAVPLVTGEMRRYVNLDYAASAPALQTVHDAVEQLLGWYSSVHRGAGFKSRASTAAYEGARESIHHFVNARDDDAVIITRNTTDAINLFAGTLKEGTQVVAFAGEHHANLLPWKRFGVRYLSIPESPAEMLENLETALRRLPRSDDPHIVTVTGASNVTGEIWPIREVARVAHENGARVLVDAAQLAPHAPIDMARDAIDYLALSGHKLYAPYGAGALIGERDWLSSGDPFLRGGGAVKLVTVDETLWADLPDRQEAGSPNVIGAVALGVACDTLGAVGMNRIAAEERELLAYARKRLAGIDGFEHYRVWPAGHPRVALLTFSLRGVPYDLLAATLSAEYGIGIRHGCFCAHPLMARLLKVDDSEMHRLLDETRDGHHARLPGAARMSMGLGSTTADVDALGDALSAIAADGPRWTYAIDPETDMYEPDPDPRPLPALGMRLVDHPREHTHSHSHSESA
ncbi:aminotransferase class V-fold PLP-dependent enzyme [Salinibacterium sp. ZJ454]|uniref:aminotransferase class V-fold PLP-dependent enzyme n=1 Tax=Salinibacterium sp. ZJ454 TaxID=2708339 RepID=UPI001420D41B|nr:aminotransferase class V-fold PLP-dependent enzyme [Salinibacterium sp. ZJ454]